MRPKPAILLILDGWGVAPPSEANAISKARTLNMDKLIASYPAMTLSASGMEAGLRIGEAGNSEAGHLNIGAGRVYYQDLPKINKAISDRSFFKNKTLLEAFDFARKKKSKVHFMGLVSPGGIHSHQGHLYALLEFAKAQKIKDVYVHAFLDGRDTLYNSGKDFVSELQDKIKEFRIGKIATIAGRFYAMDRDNRWDRTEKAYNAIVEGRGESAKNPIKALELSYAKKVFDEEFAPTVIVGKDNKPIAKVDDNDVVIFFNFRADRVRQLSKALALDDFSGFIREKLPKTYFVSMTEYERDLPAHIVFAPEIIKNPLAKVISENGLRQIHIAETEKYAHITFFINGQRENPFPGEDRAVIPSPHVASYKARPEMSARAICDKLIKEIKAEEYDFIIANFANADMVGHTGSFEATVKAIEFLDKCIGQIVEQVLLFGGALFITSDHGNAESAFNLQMASKDKEHSTNPVPFLIVGEEFEGKNMGLPEAVGADLSLVPPVGALADVAPTILKVLEIKQPPEMTGKSLI